jgi:hypothetical protein
MKLSIDHIRPAMLLPFLLLLGACATNRSYIALDVPAGAGASGMDPAKVAVIGEIVDQREFQENPRDPSIPSLKKGEEYKLDAQGKLQAIARKRNGYGKAIGDIQLQPPQSVTSITRQLVVTGFQQRGFRVIGPGEAAPANAVRVDVDITKFWAWMNPGFWTLRMDSQLETTLKLSGGKQASLVVAASGNKYAQTGMEDNWKQAYERTFQDYLDTLKAELEKAGL